LRGVFGGALFVGFERFPWSGWSSVINMDGLKGAWLCIRGPFPLPWLCRKSKGFLSFCEGAEAYFFDGGGCFLFPKRVI